MSILFSILIPAFKAKFLRECIASILGQSFQSFEIIIVNDASPEDIDSVVRSFNDERIKYYINEKNYGAIDVVSNWNKCLQYATGDYAICLGDDDKMTSTCLLSYVSLINKYPKLGVYHMLTEIIDEDSNFIDIQQSRPEYESVYSLAWHRWNGRNKQYIGDFCFDIDLLRHNGGFFKLPLAWGSDDITAIIAAKEKGIANTQSIGFQYRVSSLTISKSGKGEEKMKAICTEMSFYDSFLAYKPEDELDLKYWQCLSNQFKGHFDKKKGICIAQDLRSMPILGIVKWYRNKGKYNLTNSILLYAIVVSLIQRVKSKSQS